MAWTVTREQTTFGNKKAVLINVITDSAEANVSTGVDVITAFSTGIKSMATATIKMDINVDSSGAAANGTIGASGFTSGDEFCLIVYGR